MWLAHALTVSRVPLAALFWAVATRPAYGAGVIAIAGLTDALDGRVARRALRRGATGRVAEAGAWLDPLCDKLFALAVLAALAVRVGTPVALLAIVAARELVVGPLAILHRVTPLHRYTWDFHAPLVGKVATVAQFVAIGALVLAVPGAEALAIVAGALGLAAVASYLWRAVRVVRAAPT
jgi:cardiolipin synthase